MIQKKNSIVQTAEKSSIEKFSFFSPVFKMENYKLLVKKVPVIAAAIEKLVRLLGSFSVETGSKALNKELEQFFQNVPVGASHGIESFIGEYFASLLTFGTAVGEIVLAGDKVAGLYNAKLEDVRLESSGSGIEVLAKNEKGKFEKVGRPSLILLSTLNAEAGEIYGRSLLEGLEKYADVLLKIFDCIGKNWERVGNVRYLVTYQPPNDTVDKAFSAQRAKLIAEEWSKTISSSGAVKDFVAVGNVEVKPIGAENQILDSSVPVRQILEMIISKLGVPPFLLGLSWSSTERMSSQQADILTSEIEAYRRKLEPVIKRIALVYLYSVGKAADIQIFWDDITLQDISEQAKAQWYLAQAEGLKGGQ